jgi:hypothetical protein
LFSIFNSKRKVADGSFEFEAAACEWMTDERLKLRATVMQRSKKTPRTGYHAKWVSLVSYRREMDPAYPGRLASEVTTGGLG